jgi:alanine racemase
MSYSAIAVLSKQNLLHNLGIIKDIAKGAKIIAMIKANAYGHGIRSVARSLDGHVEIFGVARPDEAMVLKKLGIETDLMLMAGVFAPEELELASQENFIVVLNNQEQIDWLWAVNLPKPLRCWIKINTGMGRLGFNLQRARQIYAQLMESDKVAKPIGIMSHFACSDDIDHPLNAEQINNFQEFAKDLHGPFSLLNSAGIVNFPFCAFDYVRPGLMLYGVSPILGKTSADYNLKPVMSLYSKIIAVQNLSQGQSVGYGASFVCDRDMRIGIVAFGYGDGYPMRMKTGAPILINGKICTLVGRVSMDMLAVDLSNSCEVKVGDNVTLWGQDLPIENVLPYTDSIVWELLTSVQNRVKFTWV